MAYHKREIKKGVIGSISKIEEELDELKEAFEEQKNPILSLVELSDLYGAIECFLEYRFSDISMDDLKQMSDLTKSSFKDGTRK